MTSWPSNGDIDLIFLIIIKIVTNLLYISLGLAFGIGEFQMKI